MKKVRLLAVIIASLLIVSICSTAWADDVLFQLRLSERATSLKTKNNRSQLFKPVYVSLVVQNLSDYDQVLEVKDYYRVNLFILVNQEIGNSDNLVPCRQMIGWLKPAKVTNAGIPMKTVHAHTESVLAFGELNDMVGPDGFCPEEHPNLQGLYPAGSFILPETTYVAQVMTPSGIKVGTTSALLTFE